LNGGTKRKNMSFADLSIDPRCLKILNSQKIVDPTPIQAESIPVALEGHDVMAIAQTGTGKTLAFGLPSLTRLAGSKKRHCQMLVLAPTRELAVQVHDVLQPMGRALGLYSACVYGGVSIDRRGAAIVVATPGRLIDHINRGNIQFRDLSILVLDEADRMLDMGFLPDITRIMDDLPEVRQTLMFSATFPHTISKLAMDLQKKPVRIEIGATATPVDTVTQEVFTVAQTGKLDLLTNLLTDREVGPVLVFLRTKVRTERISNSLSNAGFKAEAIHGDRSQGQRQRAINNFRKGRCKILVATDVAARGLDVDGISHVVNFDIPSATDDYIHRIGRTARANATGTAITFVTPADGGALADIEKSIDRNIPRVDWDGAVHVNMRPSSKGKRSNGRKPSVGSRSDRQRSGARANAQGFRARTGEQRSNAPQGKKRYGARNDEQRPKAGGKAQGFRPRNDEQRSDTPQGKKRYGARNEEQRTNSGAKAQNFRPRNNEVRGDAPHSKKQFGKRDSGQRPNAGAKPQGFRGRNGEQRVAETPAKKPYSPGKDVKRTNIVGGVKEYTPGHGEEWTNAKPGKKRYRPRNNVESQGTPKGKKGSGTSRRSKSQNAPQGQEVA
jgi:ATP-dependent RNA helicase RhlE